MTKCPVCRKSETISLRDSLIKTKNYLCQNCGLVFIPRSSTALHDYYKQDGYFKSSPNLAYKENFISKRLLIEESEGRIAGALKVFPAQLKGKTVLDVGCGYGEILYVFKNEYGCKVEGIEPSKMAASLGSEMFSLPINSVLLEEYKPRAKFNVVWSSHVLEHTTDPSAFLTKINGLLKSEGYLYLEVPNILKPTGGFSLSMFLYHEHLQTFSAYNLYLLLNRHGLSVVAYSDSGFLKFWCKKSRKGVIPKKVTAKEILDFMHKYKEGYNILSTVRVYAQKLFYGVKLAFYKASDIF